METWRNDDNVQGGKTMKLNHQTCDVVRSLLNDPMADIGENTLRGGAVIDFLDEGPGTQASAESRNG
jgi:hypothetical protein